MTRETLTGCPDSRVGEKRAWRAAATAACCKSGWPLTAVAETTRPDSSTRICTVTVPCARAAFAIGGEAGCGFEIALPVNTPPHPNVFFRSGGGFGCRGGGGAP